MAAEQIASADDSDPLTRALSTGNLRRRGYRFKRLGASLAADLENAFKTLATLENEADREAFIQGMFGVLANGDPPRALEAAKRLEDSGDKKAALTLLANRWAGPAERDERDTIIELEFGSDASLEGSLGMKLLNHWPPRPEYAAQWAQVLAQGDERMTLLSYAAAKQYLTNPGLAESYGREFVGEKQIEFQQKFAHNLGATEPEAAWRWTETLADSVLRHNAQDDVLNSAAGTNSIFAARKVAETPSGTFKDQTISLVAQLYGSTRPDEAVEWARSLPEKEAAIALPAVAPTAAVRMGMVLATDAEGYPFISNTSVVPGSPEAAALHPYDRIVGVSGATGGFVDVRNMGLLQVAELIKGPAGSTVQLQLASRLAGGGYGTPTTMQLTRPSPRGP